MKKLIFPIAFLVVILGCKEDNSIAPPTQYMIEGEYQYQGFDLDSTLRTYGIVNLVLNDTIITGNRDIQGTDTISSQNIEVGVSNIYGFMYGDSTFCIYLDEGPEIPAILLVGKFSTGVIRGPRVFEHRGRPAPIHIGHYTLQKLIRVIKK